jgi:hypothetical protein
MGNPKETGYEMNVVNFDVIIQSALGYGAKFNPAKAALALSSLQDKSGKCKEANSAVQASLSDYKSAVDEREAAFDKFRLLLTRVSNAMKVADISPENIETAKEFIRKIHGKRANGKNGNGAAAGNEPATKQISVSQMGYDNQIKNAAQLISFLSTKSYGPNEPELRTDSLLAVLADLKKKNEAVIAASSALFKARVLRNELMFKDGTGLVPIAQEAKLYVKSLFGPSSEQFRRISGLKFRSN